jgi:hypothetical protein
VLEEADLPQRVQTEQLEQDDVRRPPRKVPSVQRGAVRLRRGPALSRCWRKRPGYAAVPSPQQAGGLREVAVRAEASTRMAKDMRGANKIAQAEH